MPIIDRAFARANQPGGGPGNPPGSRMITWDVSTGEASVVPVPEGGHTVVQAAGGPGGGGGARPFIWDFRTKTASFAFGVFNSGRELISIGVVGP